MTSSKDIKKRGFSLVEVLFAVSIILVFVVSLVGVHNLYLNASSANADNLKALLLLEEGVEAVRFMRDTSWTDNIAPAVLGNAYYLNIVGTNWVTTNTPELIDGKFDRTVRLMSVARDANGRITSSGGTVDANTRLLVSSVSWWKGGATTTKSISTYITDIHDN